MEQGTMINVKKGLGVALAFIAIDIFYPLNFLDSFQFLYPFIIFASAFFLIKSGARK